MPISRPFSAASAMSVAGHAQSTHRSGGSPAALCPPQAGPGLEIERKFLVAGRPTGAGKVIEQGYLAVGDPEVRVRRSGERYTLTVKASGLGPVGGDRRIRHEEEVVLTADQEARLLALAPAARLTKTRYRMGPWEVDVYDGALADLVVAEVELPSPDAPLPPMPAELGASIEITDDLAFRNQALAALSPDEARALVEKARAALATASAPEARTVVSAASRGSQGNPSGAQGAGSLTPGSGPMRRQ